MKEYSGEQIRNIALVGHGGCGKTSLAESLLFSAKAINRLGKVEDGSTVSDYTEEEIRRTISISGTLLHCEYKNHKINILDLPGFADFTGEVVTALRVIETALLVVDAIAGPEAGSEYAFELAEKYNTPLALAINKIEKEHANFQEALSRAQERFSNRVLPVQLPIGEAATFKGFVDLVKMKAYEYKEDGSVTDIDIPGDMEATCRDARDKLVEAAAEADDALLEKYFDAGELTPDEIKVGLKKAITNRVIYPVFVTSATTNRGARPLLDFILQFFPAPADITEINVMKGEEVVPLITGEDEPFCAFVFKTLIEKHVGELTLFKLYSGNLKAGDEAYNTNRGSSEKIGQVFTLNGKERTEMTVVHAGDIGALVKLKDTHSSDTLCVKKDGIQLPPIEYPSPNIDFAVKPVGKGDEEKMSTGLNSLRREDPTFQFENNPELKQTILHGQGEMHLDVIASKLKNIYGIEVELQEPLIPYRETITGKTETQYRYKKQTGGRGQYGDVHIRIAPLKRGEGFDFVNKISGGVIPVKFIPSVEKGIVEAMQQGGLSGHKVVDLKVTLFYGSFHTVDSSDMAFKVAGSMAFKQAFLQCAPVLLEPIYDLEIVVPDENTGDVMGDMSSRRGKIMGMEPKGKYQLVRGQAPLAELYKYSTSLRSITGGRGRHSQKFSHYETVPKEITEKIVAAYRAAKSEDK
ncbi:MAG: elongation factor G [candidate division Zixibacteria bacterium]|nr:elongation factor G [candidate division Zixibacteria bacterium]